MERIEIVTALVAAHIAAGHTHGLSYVQESSVQAADYLADMIIANNIDFRAKIGVYDVKK